MERKNFPWNLVFTISFPILIAVFCLPTHAVTAQTSCVGTGKAAGTAKVAINEPSVPFRIGETLIYHVTWAGFSNAAIVELSVAEHREILGWRTWHFRASAHTLSPLRSFMTVDDQLDSYADVKTFESRQYETHLSEMGSIENQILRPSSVAEPHRSGIPVVVVLPGTLDPLGTLFDLRTVDWRQTPEFHAPVYDGEDLIEVRARLEVPNETVAVDAGNFSAARISIRLYKKGEEIRQESFSLWLANDLQRTPVLLQAEMPLGSVRVELTSSRR
ncbi:MAG TPA: DUF3108 domain-containing protein [Candidatus Acidoferrales bacterium]|nr:DUF3108 domain-containing protein [Candidatus Acidoferrales bacterium]